MKNDLILKNKNIYDRIAPLYERQHDEIFNQVEQGRICRELEWALSQISSVSVSPKVLDFGSGTGNLTRHILSLGGDVVAADISEGCLRHLVNSVGDKCRLNTLLLNGCDLKDIKSNTFDMVAAYSVLHHIPDYIKSVQELLRVVKPGGIVYLDHENSPDFWGNSKEYACYSDELARQEVKRDEGVIARFRRVFLHKGVFRHIRAASWSLFNSSMGEGDIHVYPDDHIDWLSIRKCLDPFCQILKEDDYLVCREHEFPPPVWSLWNGLCTDMRLLVAKKNG